MTSKRVTSRATLRSRVSLRLLRDMLPNECARLAGGVFLKAALVSLGDSRMLAGVLSLEDSQLRVVVGQPQTAERERGQVKPAAPAGPEQEEGNQRRHVQLADRVDRREEVCEQN